MRGIQIGRLIGEVWFMRLSFFLLGTILFFRFVAFDLIKDEGISVFLVRLE